MFKKFIIGLFLTYVLAGVPISDFKNCPITIIQVNPETNEEIIKKYYVNIFDEFTYQNIVYENFTVDNLVVTLKPFDTYRPNYKPKTYTITYIDGEHKYISWYTYGENIVLEKPLLENHPYEFSLGYFDDAGNKCKNRLIKPNGNLILYSKWQGKEYNIFYDGKLEDTYRYGEKKELKTPTKEGYNFEGWYLNDEKISIISEKTHGDISLISKWAKLTTYKPSRPASKTTQWKIKYIVVKDYDKLQSKLDAGYVCYYKGNILLGHNPGVFSWLPKTKVNDIVIVNGTKYVIVDKFKTTFSNPEYKAWWQPGDLALVTCYGGGLNRLIVILNKVKN